MAEKDAAEEEHKPGDNQPPVADAILAQQADPTAESDAEQSIRGFIADRLNQFVNDMADATDALEAYLQSQSAEDQAIYNQPGFYGFIGDQIAGDLYNLVGSSAPLMASLVGEFQNSVDSSGARDVGVFFSNAKSGLKAAASHTSDAASSILDGQWGDLLKLAADGNNQFIPALFQLGLPSFDFNAVQFAGQLKQHADAYKTSMSVQRAQVKDSGAADQDKAAEIEEQAQDELLQGDAKKTQQVK